MISFWVAGVPLPKGSGQVLRGNYVESADRATKTRKAGALKRWSETLAWSAKRAWREPPLDGPVRIILEFVTRRNWPEWASGSGDIDKLERTVLDALEGIVYTNDARVVRMESRKRRGSDLDPEGVHIHVGEA